MSLLSDLIVRFSFGAGQRRFTRFVAIASMLGMVLGVAALITVLSVMNGFAGELTQRLLAVTPHVLLQPLSSSDSDQDTRLADALMARPEVVAAAPYRSGRTLLRAHGQSRGVQISGSTADGLASVIALPQHVIQGELSLLDEQRFSIALGSGLARMLDVFPGDSVEVILPRLTVSPMGTFPRARELTVVALFEVGAQPDMAQAFVSLETAERLFGSVGERGVQVRLGDRDLAPRFSGSVVTELTGTMRASDWTQSQGSLFAAIKMEKLTVGLLLLSVIVVAAFNLISSLTMSVTEKRADIAILQVMGLSSDKLLWIFLGHGLLLGSIGIFVGGIVGVWLAQSISEVSYWIERLTGWALFDPAVYYIGGLPSRVLWSDVLWVVGAALILSLLASAYPAWRATRIPPVEALNYV